MRTALRWLADIRDDTSQLVIDLAVVRRRVTEIAPLITQIRRLIVTTSQDVIARFDAATNEVAADLSDLRTRLEAAVADKDEAVRSAVASVLSEFDAPLAKLEALGQDPENPVPDAPVEEPVTEEPVTDEPQS